MDATTEAKRVPKPGVVTVARIIDGLTDLGGWLSVLCLVTMAIIVMFEIVARYSFNQPTIWALELTEYLLVMCAFFGTAYVLKENRHISIDLLTSKLVPRTRVMLEAVTLLGVLFFSGVLLWYGQKVLATIVEQGRVSATLLHLPMWIPKSSVPIGASLLVLQVSRMLYQRVGLLFRGEIGSGTPLSRLSLQNPVVLLPLYLGLLGFEIWLLLANPILAMVLLLLTLLMGGVPVAFSLGLAGCIMLVVLLGEEGGLIQAPLVAYKSLESFVLVAVPLFVFGASILSRGRLGEQLYDIAAKFVGHLPGGLAVATVIAGAIFGAVCGSSVASAATFGLIAIPIMLKRGYNKRLVYGTVAISGTLASMIPPSLGMILYGSVTDVSVGQLFMAGMIPGIMQTVTISLLILYMCRGGRNHTPIPKATWKERFLSLKKGIFALLAPVVILGGIYRGIFTPTEAAAVAVLYALLVTIFVLRTVRWKEMKQILTDSVKTTVMLLSIIIGALILGHMFTYLQIPIKFMTAVQDLSPWMVMILINVLIIFMGCLLEGASIILLTVPVVYPALTALGFNPIWFGIVLTANLEIAMLTPPVGMNLFVIQGITRDKISEVIQGAWPFIMLQTLNLAILMAFPILSTWLPGTMKW